MFRCLDLWFYVLCVFCVWCTSVGMCLFSVCVCGLYFCMCSLSGVLWVWAGLYVCICVWVLCLGLCCVVGMYVF